MSKRADLIRQHTPNLTDEDEELIYERVTRFDEDVTAGDYALRTCSCGLRVDGFYEYTDHLIAELDLAGL